MASTPDTTRLTRTLAGVGVVGVSAAVFWRTAYPTITWWDSANYSLAAATLGVTSSPGSLLLTLLGWLVTRLPLGLTPARVLALFAGVLAAVTDYQLGVGYENHTSHPSRGDLLWYPGGISETELLFAYGSSRFGSKVGQLAGNHFLEIIEGRERLDEMGRYVLYHGAQDIVFEAA